MPSVWVSDSNKNIMPIIIMPNLMDGVVQYQSLKYSVDFISLELLFV